ncbi:ATP-dependent DNA helicase RecG [Fictibacillus phosphorivorans]|uniref:ATP-dependent DNA helicase RecG n=1 Tax=Fictibacillus phosphorivorans TaxID=1221500 RepID=A0A160ILM1_9BACL|nr:ATP-dependent DNA helicase RecG [Fictibacillus phosphorivorans]ANC76827.1 ATP-dependent DNA helicase RecG [Fictibacillus phosphorivorans]
MLNQSITTLNGIGEKKAEELSSMGIHSVEDLLEYLPYRYEDYQKKDLAEIAHDEKATIEGKVHSEPSLRYFPKKKSRLTFRMLIGKYLITATIFNRPFLKNQIALGQTLTVTGKWDRNKMTITVSDVHFGTFSDDHKIEPVYSVKGSLYGKTMRKIIDSAFRQFSGEIEDPLPLEIRESYRLPDRESALKMMHFPEDFKALKAGRRRLAYEELLYFQLKMQIFRKWNRQQSKGAALKFDQDQVETFIRSLPFQLTDAQQRVVDEILRDLSDTSRMNRLLQGDVGSGKTVVAAVALFAAVTANRQGALMVPTEILAEQHFQSLKELFAPFGITVALLTSSVKGKMRRETLNHLQQGEIQIMVGTHALIQEEVNFNHLGLVITDEQHRFGVNQRRVLREKGESPDVLFMTATPIPRTLAISAFGDMDVSTIDVMPAGRKPIITNWAKHGMLNRVLEFIKKEIESGRQAYVICPLIEESEKIDVQNAIDVHAQLSAYFQTYQVGLMHGRLHSTEKDEVMRKFAANECQILVSTTVVEVGVNVPNATIMVIYDAERFGLSQLHQLRGRVGRGSEQSYCVLIADPKSEEGQERMRIMTETTNGFELSEKDLELRGPGDFFGNKQSGVPNFKVADLVHDYRILETARNDAARLVQSEEFWRDENYRSIREVLTRQGVLDKERLD